MKHIIALGICISLVTVTFSQEANRPIPNINQLEYISLLSSTLWWAEFRPDGYAKLGSGSNNSAEAPKGSFSFEEIYNLLVPHLKGTWDGKSPVMSVRLSVPNQLETRYSFYLEDKEVMRKIMHGLCEKVVPRHKTSFEDALRKHPLVPGDPPYLKDAPLTENRPAPTDDANPEKIQIERSLEFWYWENGKRNATYKTMKGKATRMDAGSAEAREYSRIARAITASGIAIPDDVAPTVDILGEWAIVTFPYVNDSGKIWLVWGRYYAEVIIETKTKAVLAIMLNRNLENKDVRDVGDFAPLIAESKAAPTTWNTFRGDEDGVMIIYSYVAFKEIRLDPGSKKVAEYVRIANTEAKRREMPNRKIPDDVLPTVAVQGDNIVVTFPRSPPEDIPKEEWDFVKDLLKGPNFSAKVVIDIKTKAVLGVNDRAVEK